MLKVPLRSVDANHIPAWEPWETVRRPRGGGYASAAFFGGDVSEFLESLLESPFESALPSPDDELESPPSCPERSPAGLLAPAVVGGVEARALEVDGDGMEHPLRRSPAHLADGQRLVGELLQTSNRWSFWQR